MADSFACLFIACTVRLVTTGPLSFKTVASRLTDASDLGLRFSRFLRMVPITRSKSAGFTKFEMGSTLTGVPLYKLRGYQVIESIAVPLLNGESLPVIRMAKSAT